jgi:phosphoribosyl 1,2-cyclic phosphate phosphodiesterase
MRVTVLGCGGSDGVPLIGGADGRGDWGACDPANPKNRRSRASVHVAAGDVGLLIDTSPDLRDQLMANGIGRISHVLYTHDHADHSHGVNELRRLSRFNGHPMDVYADAATMARLHRRFAYAFEQLPGSPYPEIATVHTIDGPFRLGGLEVRPVAQDHGFGETTLGFRIGNFGYSTDVVGFSDEAFDALSGLELWIVDCYRDAPHPTHAHWDLTMSWIERLRPRRAVLTHMGAGLDYEAVRRRCPAGVEPGYDGMTIEL